MKNPPTMGNREDFYTSFWMGQKIIGQTLLHSKCFVSIHEWASFAEVMMKSGKRHVCQREATYKQTKQLK